MAGTKPWRRRALKGAGYFLFAAVVYILALWQLFPYRELARNVEARLRSKGVEVHVQDLGPGAFPGFKAQKVRISQGGESTWGVEFSPAQVHVPLLRLVRGERAVELEGSTLGGRIQALALLGKDTTVRASWKGLDLARLRLPSGYEELPLAGTVTGQLEATMDPSDPGRLTGRVDSDLAGVKLGAGKVRNVSVPELSLGNGTLRITAQDGKVDVENAGFEGGDLGIDFKGSVLLRPDLERSLVNGVLSLVPNEKATKELALLFAVFPGQKGSDGRYTARLRGSLNAPRLMRR